MNVLQKSVRAGLNLSGTVHAGKSAAELRRDDPKLALRWSRFIKANKAQLVKEIAGMTGGAR